MDNLFRVMEISIHVPYQESIYLSVFLFIFRYPDRSDRELLLGRVLEELRYCYSLAVVGLDKHQFLVL